MTNHPHPIIARTGWPFLAIALVLAIGASAWCAAWSIPLWITALFVLQLFRDPARTCPQDEGAVLSPLDRHILAAERTRDAYSDRDATKVGGTTTILAVLQGK